MGARVSKDLQHPGPLLLVIGEKLARNNLLVYKHSDVVVNMTAYGDRAENLPELSHWVFVNVSVCPLHSVGLLAIQVADIVQTSAARVKVGVLCPRSKTRP